MASQITSLTIVYSSVYSGGDQRKHQSSVSLAFVRGIHRRPVNSPHEWPVTRKVFPFDDVIMWPALSRDHYIYDILNMFVVWIVCIIREMYFVSPYRIDLLLHRRYNLMGTCLFLSKSQYIYKYTYIHIYMHLIDMELFHDSDNTRLCA